MFAQSNMPRLNSELSTPLLVSEHHCVSRQETVDTLEHSILVITQHYKTVKQSRSIHLYDQDKIDPCQETQATQKKAVC